MTTLPPPKVFEQDCGKLADSYLDHILLALDVEDRGAPYRTFFDNWYAYQRGEHHLTSGDRPIWFNNPCAQKHHMALSAMHFVSTGSEQVLEMSYSDPDAYRRARENKTKSVRLMIDHATPIRVLVADLSFERPRTRDDLRAYLNANYRLGLITWEEEARLRRAGFVSSVPDLWDGSPFARYAHAKITSSASGCEVPA